MLPLAAVVALPILAFYLIKRRGWSRRLLPLPPGPPGLPLVGNILNLPKENRCKVFHDWAKEYNSDVVYLNMAGKHLIVVDTFEALTELLEQRSATTSSRPYRPLISDVAGWNFAFSMLPYGSRWRARRKLMHQSFHTHAVKQFRPQQLEAARSLLKGLLKTPENFIEHIHLSVARVILASIYGHDVDSAEHPYIVHAEKATSGFTSPRHTGIRMVDFLPFLLYLPSWFPGAGAKRDAQEWRVDVMKFLDSPMADAKAKIDAGLATRSFVSDHVENINQEEDTFGQYEVIKHVAAQIYAAGFETTVSSLMTFLLAMALFPDVQRRAQEELDTVLHGDLPTFDDEQSLPYMQALLLELLRWGPAAPTSLPHYTLEEEEYNGYRIPANAIITTNSWAMLHDETQYPAPHEFNPDRFLGKDGRINPSVRDPRLIAFGSGRRICPGRHFVESTLWITAASILTLFEISGAVSKEDGRVLNPSNVEWTSGTVSAPKPFTCTIKPRSEKNKGSIDNLGLL